MRADTAAVVDVTLRRSPLHTYFRRKAAGSLVVLAYHGVDDAEQFDEHLRRLTRWATPVSLDDVLTAMHGGSALPSRSVLVTFDDGYPSVLEQGLPRLRAYGVPAVAFVVPGLANTDHAHWWDEADHLVRHGGRTSGTPLEAPEQIVRWMKSISDDERLTALEELRATAHTPAPATRQLTTADLRRLDASGVAVENHSWTHPLLDRCSPEKVQDELVRSHRWLSENLGRAPRAFAYPNGNWDARAEETLAGLGYEIAFLFDHRLSPRLPDHPLRVSRVRIDSTTSIPRFDLIVSGLHPALHHLRGRA